MHVSAFSRRWDQAQWLGFTRPPTLPGLLEPAYGTFRKHAPRKVASCMFGLASMQPPQFQVLI